MQRSIFSSLTRALVNRSGLKTVSMLRPVPRPVATGPRISPFRFASTKSTSDGAKSENEENSKKDDGNIGSKENKQEAANEAQANAKPELTEPTPNVEIGELKTKLEQKDKDLADMKNHYARSIADFRNLQDSTKKEIQKAKDFALQKFAKDLLESLDNFSLALNAVKEETLKSNPEVKNLYDGVEMTRSVFEKTLNKHGIEKVDPMGEQFDPNKHEATFEIPQPDKEPGTVFHVEQPGYTLNSRVLRPAKVGLVKGTDN